MADAPKVKRQFSTKFNFQQQQNVRFAPATIATLSIMSNEEPPLHLSDLQIDDGEKEKPVRSAAVEQDAREEALRAELAGVQQINSVIEGVISSLEKAKENMEVSFEFLISVSWGNCCHWLVR